MKVCIFTEGGKYIGFGHITRCVSLYHAFTAKGIHPEFIVNGDSTIWKMLQNKNCKFLDWANNKNETLSYLKRADVAVIDSYKAKPKCYERMANAVKLALYIDDNRRLNYPKGIVVNGAVLAENLNYPKKRNVKYLLGRRYAFLRKDFWNTRQRKVEENIKNVLVTFGGNFIGDAIHKVVEYFAKNWPQLNIFVILGVPPENIPEVKKIRNSNMFFYWNITAACMRQVMEKADVAVSGGGQTLYELARVGVPTIAATIANNQMNNVLGWQKLGFIEYAGWAGKKNFVNNLDRLFQNMQSKKRRTDMSNKGRKAIDGKGAGRIVEAIVDGVKG